MYLQELQMLKNKQVPYLIILNKSFILNVIIVSINYFFIETNRNIVIDVKKQLSL